MKQPDIPFSPIHGLASLGAGGLAVSFFVWLMFLTPHPDSPVPTVETLLVARSTSDSGWIDLVLALVGLMATGHFALLGWWQRQSRQIPVSQRAKWQAGEEHIFTLLTPLILAMSINVGFILGLLFVPGFWSFKEVLFPIALVAFAGLGAMALDRWRAQIRLARQLNTEYLGKGLIELLTAFAFAMIAVGFSATAAMSQTLAWHAIATVLALASVGIAVGSALHVLRLRLPRISSLPIHAASAGSLLMGVPILAVLGITVYRLLMAVQHHVGLDLPPMMISSALGIMVLGQWAIFVLAVPKLVRQGGWQTLIVESPQGASFSLVCPGVGAFVLGMFFVSKGLLEPGFISLTQAIVGYTVLAIIQLLTIALFIYLLIHAMPRRRRYRKEATRLRQTRRSVPIAKS